MRRDLVDSCPVLVFDRTPALGDFENIDAMVDALEDAHAVQSVPVTVMTQACDLAENTVRDAIPCPAGHVMDFRADRERREMDRGQKPAWLVGADCPPADTLSSPVRRGMLGNQVGQTMTETARKLLHVFDSLPEPERREVAREILRRTALAEHGPLDDAELLTLADEVLLELDRGETLR